MSPKEKKPDTLFDGFAAEAAEHETPERVEITDLSGDPYVTKTGERFWIDVVGEYSRQAQKNERRISDKMLMASRKGVEFDAEFAEDSQAQRIGGCCVAWNLETKTGDTIPFSIENAVRFLKAAPWVAPQLQKRIKAHGGFFDPSSTD